MIIKTADTEFVVNNTKFSELPDEIKKSAYKTSGLILEEIKNKLESNEELDDIFFEKTSAIIYNELKNDKDNYMDSSFSLDYILKTIDVIKELNLI